MKVNPDLIRGILLEAEEKGETTGWYTPNFPDYSLELIHHHVVLLHKEGLIERLDADTQDALATEVRRLSPEGHNYIDSLHDGAQWKKYLRSGASSLAMESAKLLLNRFLTFSLSA